MTDRFLLVVPLCAAAIALSSLAWHSEPSGGGRAARYGHLRRDVQLRAAAEGAWDDGDWFGEQTEFHTSADSLRSAESGTCPESKARSGSGAYSETSRVEGGGDEGTQHQGRAGGACRSSETGARSGGDAAESEEKQHNEDEAEWDEEEDGGTAEGNTRVRMCAAAAADQVQCVLNSGGGARGECSTSKLSSCLARLEIARAGPKAATVLAHTKYGRMVLPLSDSFEGLALLMYGEWMEWGLMVLKNLITQGGVSTILDVNPGTGGATLALAKMVGSKGRMMVSEPRKLFMQSLAASAHLCGLQVRFLPCLSSHAGFKDMLEINATLATGLGKVDGADALRAHARFPTSCSTVDAEFANDPAGVDLIRISTCALHPWRPVLEGALKIIRTKLPILYIESRARGDLAMEVETFLVEQAQLEYKCFWSAGRMFRPDNWRQVTTNIYDDSMSVFYQLCVPSRILLHGLRPVSADLHHKHKQVALPDVLFSSFATFDLSWLQVRAQRVRRIGPTLQHPFTLFNTLSVQYTYLQHRIHTISSMRLV